MVIPVAEKNYSRTKQDVWQLQGPALFIFQNKIRKFAAQTWLD